MADYIESLQRLTEQFARLEGVGRKSAGKMAFSVLDMSEEDAAELAAAILDVKQRIHLCPVCMNITDRDICPICSDLTRDDSVVCVVSDVKAVITMERVREYRGRYHVLHGVISPLNGVKPDDLKIKELLDRVHGGRISEVILATNPTAEGEATAMYIAGLLKPIGIRVTRIAYGIPMGADLEYSDEITLSRALAGRIEF